MRQLAGQSHPLTLIERERAYIGMDIVMEVRFNDGVDETGTVVVEQMTQTY